MRRRRHDAFCGLGILLWAVVSAGCGPKKVDSPFPIPPASSKDAPPLELGLSELDRTPRTLSELTKEVRATVLVFVTSGSDDGLIYAGRLNGVVSDWVPYGVLFLGISLDRDPALAESYAAGAKLGFPLVLADDDLWDGRSPLGRILAVPMTVVLDAAGQVRFYEYGLVPTERLEGWLDELLAETAP